MSKYPRGSQSFDIHNLQESNARLIMDMPGDPQSKMDAAMNGFMDGLSGRMGGSHARDLMIRWIEREFKPATGYGERREPRNHWWEDHPFPHDPPNPHPSATEAEYKRKHYEGKFTSNEEIHKVHPDPKSPFQRILEAQRAYEDFYSLARGLLPEEKIWETFCNVAKEYKDLFHLIKRRKDTQQQQHRPPPPPPPQSKSWWGYELGFTERKAYTQAEVKSAYRRKVQIYHPDKGGSAEAFAKINSAYQEGMKESNA